MAEPQLSPQGHRALRRAGIFFVIFGTLLALFSALRSNYVQCATAVLQALLGVYFVWVAGQMGGSNDETRTDAGSPQH